MINNEYHKVKRKSDRPELSNARAQSKKQDDLKVFSDNTWEAKDKNLWAEQWQWRGLPNSCQTDCTLADVLKFPAIQRILFRRISGETFSKYAPCLRQHGTEWSKFHNQLLKFNSIKHGWKRKPLQKPKRHGTLSARQNTAKETPILAYVRKNRLYKSLKKP